MVFLFLAGEHDPDPFSSTRVACHEFSTPFLSVIQKSPFKNQQQRGRVSKRFL